MTTQIKNYLGIAIIISIIIFVFSFWNFANSYSKSIEPSSFRSFSVSGEGKIVAVPDIAQFNFSIITEGGKNLTALQKENTDKANKAISFIKSKGIDSKDIKTEGYNVYPRYQNYDCTPKLLNQGSVCPPPEIVGYSITQSVSVKVKDFEKIGDLLSGIVNNGANSVSGISFTVDNPTKFENEARKNAMSEAKEKAKAVAEAGGFRLGRLLSVEENGQFPPYYRELFPLGKGGEDAAMPSPTIEPGSQEVIINVTLKYEIL